MEELMPNYLYSKPKNFKFEVRTDHDEVYEIWLVEFDDYSKKVKEEKLSYLNHDMHGWDGIEAGIELVKSIAKEIGAEFEDGIDLYEAE